MLSLWWWQMHCSVPYIYSFGLLLEEIELVPQRCNIQILWGLKESCWLTIKTNEQRTQCLWGFWWTVMYHHMQYLSPALSINSSYPKQKQWQISPGKCGDTMKFLTGFGSEMALVLESKSAVSRGVSPSVCVHACLSPFAQCPLGVTRDVQGPRPDKDNL